MIYRMLLTATIVILTAARFARADWLSPVLVDTPLSQAYAPMGFDSNDRAQLVATGSFPNSCYKVGPVVTKVDPDQKTITVRQQAYLYFGYCLQMIIPFAQVVDLGILPAGSYRVVDGASHRELATLPITTATRPEADDYLYLPVSDAYLRHQASPAANELYLTGSFSDHCTRFKEAIINYYDNVIVVQPVAEHSASGGSCAAGNVPFSIRVVLKPDLHGTHLVHVRSLNGQAINKLFDFDGEGS